MMFLWYVQTDDHGEIRWSFVYNLKVNSALSMKVEKYSDYKLLCLLFKDQIFIIECENYIPNISNTYCLT